MLKFAPARKDDDVQFSVFLFRNVTPAGNSLPYIVTLTVSDLDGLKKPSKTTTKVTVTL